MGLESLIGNVLGGVNGNNQQQNYNQNYNNQNYNNQNYGQQPHYDQNYNNQNYQQPQNGPIQPLGQGQYSMTTENELYCKVSGSGMFFAKKGSMVAFNGDFKFSKRLLGTNGGNIVGQVLNHAARKMTGENNHKNDKRKRIFDK